MFVVGINIENNTVVLGEADAVFRDSMTVEDINWITVPEITAPMETEIKIRYAAKPAPAVIIPLAEGRVSVKFTEPQRAVTPGQSAVFYTGDAVLGGGRICSEH